MEFFIDMLNDECLNAVCCIKTKLVRSEGLTSFPDQLEHTIFTVLSFLFYISLYQSVLASVQL